MSGYLVVGRKINEGFKIGEEIEVYVVRITETGRVDIAVKAPRQLKIERETKDEPSNRSRIANRQNVEDV